MKKIKIGTTRVFKVILGIFLLALAIILFSIMTFFGLGFSLISPFFIKDNRNIGEILDGIAAYFIAIAASVDQTGNAAFGRFLTWGLVNTNKQKHSIHIDIDDTISEITGWNELENSQGRLGPILSKILNTAEKEHGLKSAANAYWKAKNKVERYAYLEEKLLSYKPQ